MPHASDTLWLITATFLVLSMQCGFLLLEGGRVRAKNSINVAQKNVSDVIVSWAVFMTFGFFLMYGVAPPLAGDGSTSSSDFNALHFLFQLGFCATAASIVSGGVAERMSFLAYLMLTVVVAALIYPLAGRLVWGDAYNPDTVAWLADLGFIDFAGATVVHGVGAACAAASVVILGSRIGRFDSNGQPRPFASHNSVLSLAGVMILLFGWLGFNGGSLKPSDPVLPLVLINTMTAAAFGGITGLIYGGWQNRGIFRPDCTCNGILGGLVAVTACAHLASTADAMIVGSLGGFVATFGAYTLLHKLRIDDPIDVIATHGLAGIVGTLSVAFVAPVSALPSGSRAEQLMVQGVGSALIIGGAFALSWLALKVYGVWAPVRVSAHAEDLGLNYTEHGQSIGAQRLQRALESKIRNFDAQDGAIELSSDDEHSELADTMARLMDKYEHAQEELDKSKNRFRHFAETASDWLFETDRKLAICLVSSSESSRGINLIEEGAALFDVLELSKRDLRHVRACIEEQRPTGTFDASIRKGPLHEDITAVEVRAVPFYSTDGQFSGYRGTLSDITQRKAAQTKALYLSLHDELTGLPNRRALATQLEEILQDSDRTQKHVVVAGIDLDGFKAVNDSHGHAYGDKVLITVAERLRSVQRENDMAYRTGGDEFVMVMPGFAPQAAISKATQISNRIIEELSNEYSIDGRTARLGASVGISVYPKDGAGSHDIARLADLALYAAKSQGKGCVVPFEPKMDVDAKRRAQLEEDLRGALERGELSLHYQPLVSLHSGCIDGIEALLRWTHPEHGNIPPLDFVPLAENLGLIDEIGAYVLHEACRYAATVPTDDRGVEITIAVNVSPLQLINENFPNVVRQGLRKSMMRPDRLELEITEQVVIQDISQAKEALNELRAIGVGIALDDFGSGQTSLGYLSQFPLTKLKIDRSFIRQIATDLQASEITRSVVTLGHSLGVKVVAEGVEEPCHLELLKRWNCDQVQGYLLSKPLPASEMTLLLELDRKRAEQKARA
ncbi:MAG: EAL domain-containing protein [Gammaproteobacteria bacterium]